MFIMRLLCEPQNILITSQFPAMNILILIDIFCFEWQFLAVNISIFFLLLFNFYFYFHNDEWQLSATIHL